MWVRIPPEAPIGPIAQWLEQTTYNCYIQVRLLVGSPKLEYVMKMRRVLVLDSQNNHVEYIDFPLDADKDFCYRSRISVTYFFQGIKDRNHNKKTGYKYHYRSLDDIYIDGWIYNTTVKVTVLKSVWEVYKYIGYDYKNQKWE